MNPLTMRDPERELVFERAFNAPARLVFLAHSAPEHLRRWYGPTNYPVTTCEMDFKVGGKFRIQLTGPDGPGPFVVGEYLRIEPHSCIEYTNGFALEGAEQMRVTCEFEDRGATSLLRMTSLFASVAMKNEHSKMGYKDGVASGHAQLDALLEEIK